MQTLNYFLIFIGILLKLISRRQFKWFILTLFFTSILVSQGSVLLVGGGSENYNDWSDAPYAWLVSKAPNKKILILHYSTATTFLPDYFTSLGATEATNLTLSSTALANDSTIYKTILNYDGIFFRGGDQWQYVSLYKGTLAEQAIKKVYARGGAIGGTSAGAMILSSIVADAKTGTVDPRSAIRNPLSSGITFTENFLDLVPNTICDTHFYERGRIARLIAMMALYHRQREAWPLGIGVDDATALGITSDGVGEVFGSGVVSFLSASNTAAYSVQSFDQLGISGIQLMQLTKGFKIHLQSREIRQLPSSLTAFNPTPFSTQSPYIILDGGNSTVEWVSSNGSVNKFIQNIGNDTVAIFTSSPSAFEIESISNLLSQNSKPNKIISVTPFSRFNPSVAEELKHTSAFIFVTIAPESLSYFTDTSSISGKLFKEKSSAPMTFLGNAASFISEKYLNKFEISTTASYRGRLTIENGLNVIKGLIVVPRIFESSDYIENRASGLPWGIGKLMPSYGLFLDNGSYVVLQNNKLEAYGSSPAIIFDVRNNPSTDFPAYIASGGVGARQNSALLSASLSIVKDSTTFTCNSTTDIKKKLIGSKNHFYLEQNYPNPFNPNTEISFTISSSDFVTLTVYDIIGRKITTLLDQHLSPGNYSIPFNARELSSGIYYYTLKTTSRQITRKAILLK